MYYSVLRAKNKDNFKYLLKINLNLYILKTKTENKQ